MILDRIEILIRIEIKSLERDEDIEKNRKRMGKRI